jgi:hypothetical protein
MLAGDKYAQSSGWTTLKKGDVTRQQPPRPPLIPLDDGDEEDDEDEEE